jgi:rsbT co-antagonist protein RsbR
MASDLPVAAAPADELTDLRAEVARLQAELRLAHEALNSLPFGVFWKDLDLVYRGVNRFALQYTGMREASSCIGRTDAELPWPPEQTERFIADDREVLARRAAKPHIVEAVRDADGQTSWVETTKAPVFDGEGALLGLVGTFRDLSDQKRAEESALAAQREALQDLATPLLPVADGVIVLPLIGAFEPARAARVMETLLTGVVRHRARVAILDITGLHTIDSAAAEGLVRAAQAIRLLGAAAIITGVRAAVAQTLVELQANLGDITVLGDLKAGIAHAIAR